ncbi:fatty acid desaturase family protein [Streptomyces sp. MZ04]|uniref:fatty acid desaturase family protein n=1 Tax=Streptomyces sp. MZ04 TaxID=2559236 RepID=UPI00107ECDD7|nr:fatty acid desaturase family protein [Streptomyces sp. MZ04]TGB14737.1 fatty acid desaturase [Streptomyces sp. MZ04]
MGKERLQRYILDGPEGDRAVAAGLADGDWFRSDVPRARLKELMRRSDYPAIRDTAVWLGALVVSGLLGSALWGGWLAVPFFLVYGVLYGSASDARWHECGHGTAFRTRWMDDTVYRLASFMCMKDPTIWRWSHTRHHTDTLVVGRDPEIVAMRPARLARILANLFGLVDVPLAFRDMALHACGRLTAQEKTFVPSDEQAKVFHTARLSLVLYTATVVMCFATGSLLPVMLIGGPRLYGACMLYVYSLTQHAGLGENVLDHRLNTRTVRMNRINRFLYWNMNYHVEHHMFPMIPYHRLPELHEEIKHDLAAPYPSIWAAYKEIVPAILRQLKDQTYYVRRELPAGAAPFPAQDDGRALPLPMRGTA